ncbi:MAG: hypothetical protein ACJ8DY_09230 [Xanthobacteraceae bacterium]
MANEGNKNHAVGQLTPAQRAADGKKATADYEAQASAVRAKTERLRALRLAREAAEGTAAPKRPAATKKRSANKAGSAASNLADWLNDQEKSGRRT